MASATVRSFDTCNGTSRQAGRSTSGRDPGEVGKTDSHPYAGRHGGGRERPHEPAGLPNGPGGTLRFLLQGEGRCKIGLELLQPLNDSDMIHNKANFSQGNFSKGNFPQQNFPKGTFRDLHFTNGSVPAVLYVSRKGGTMAHPKPGTLSAVERDRVDRVRRLGMWVVLVDVCGFGVLGDSAGDAFGLFDLPSWDYR